MSRVSRVCPGSPPVSFYRYEYMFSHLCARRPRAAIVGNVCAIMASTKQFPPDARDALISWFKQYGAKPEMEIEFRVQEVGEAGFEQLLSSLQSNRGWSNIPKPSVTLDRMHATGVRETIEMGPNGQPLPKPAQYLRKVKGHDVPWTTPSGVPIKFAVASEKECSADPSPVHLYRHKQRYSFVHKNLFKFELTRVKQGPTNESASRAETQFEVELEFCGQGEVGKGISPEYLADSMLMKAADLVHQLVKVRGGEGAAGAPNRPSTADGPVQEGDEVVLAPGTEVALAESGHGAGARFDGEMPAELAASTGWIFSHRVPESGLAFVMSEPTQLVGQAYPLYYFCGTVPYAAVRRKPRGVV